MVSDRVTYALVADCVSKSFGRRAVLTSATLRATPGQVRVIFGRNGSGKSTLVKIAVGMMSPDAGAVHVNGRVLLRSTLAGLARLGVFYLPDHDILSRSLPLRKQLQFFADRFRQRSVEDAADMSKVDALLDHHPDQLSGGELRRAELALACARRPSVLIADEPYRGIAPVDHERLTSLFRAFAADGCAVVITGHEVPSLLAAADHVTWCTSGTTLELGTPEQARANDAFRKGYLGPRGSAHAEFG